MGIAAAPEARYESAIRKFFPQGAYWDEQFADSESDASLFVKAKAAELIRFRERMGALLAEGKPESTTELISDWERVLLGGVFSNLGISRRRLQLQSKNDLKLSRAELQKTAAAFGLNIQDVAVPYRPRCFGFAKFAQERIGSFSAFSVVRIAVTEAGLEAKHWQAVKAEWEPRRFARMRFAKMRETVWREIRRGCFGHGKFAYNRLTPFPADEARQLANGRIDAGRVTRLFFGQSRLLLFSCRFDPGIVLGHDFFSGYIADILRAADFYKRFKRALLDEYFARVKPYCEFEEAVSNKLLANQIPFFYYGGE